MQSYRDTWTSEGFAHFSTALFLQAFHTDKQAGDYMKFWEDQRRLLLERNNMGFRAIDLPLTLGPRSNNFRTGSIYNRLVYSKGAYVLHMIRRMMWSPQNGDQRFRDMMHDYVTTYSGRAASTEDFKAMVEKHITPEMDVNHDGKLDWFFNEFVYGTALPSYRMQASFEPGADGNVALKIHMEQSNVDDDFLMLVPIYLELANGKIVRLGMVPMAGNRTFEKTIPLGGVKETPRRAMLNYYDDVLCTTN
jgi:aminopeptidase N